VLNRRWMAVAGLTAAIAAAAYMISSRQVAEPALEDAAAAESSAGDTDSTTAT